MTKPDPKKQSQSLPAEDLVAAHAAEHQPSYDQKWAALQASDAPLVRQALIRAEQLRSDDIDAGDAYLQGVADLNYFRERQHLVETVQETFVAPPADTN